MKKIRHLIIIICAALYICLQSIQLIADSTGITTYQRTQIGEMWTRNFHLRNQSIYDPIAEDFSLRILNDLAPNAKLYSSNLNVILIDESDINAFSVIGNVIGINKGLYQQLSNIDEVYGILAHELAHIGQNHMIRSVENRGEKSTLLIASIIAAVLLSKENAELSTALIILGFVA